MSRSIVAKRYAKALFEAASDENIVDRVEQDLTLVVGLINENIEFKKVLEHPNIAKENKIELFKVSLQEHVSTIVFNIIRLIVLRGREAMMADLLEEYAIIANEKLGRADAIVYSAYELSDEERKQIAATFGKITGKAVKINSIVDNSVLGGLRVRIGDHLYDGTLSNKLVHLQNKLMQEAL